MAACNLEQVSFDNKKLEFLNRVAKSSGLSSQYLLISCSWIESKEIDERRKLKLIECLIPKPNGGTIPEDVCIRLARLLKTSQISVLVKVELLKWMISVHAFMETRGKFQMLYEFFFGLLNNNEMRPYAAHFLLLITQKKHATVKRVKSLFRFIDKYDHQPCFNFILHAFYLHAPECFEDEFDDCNLPQFEPLGAYPDLIKNVHHTYDAPNFCNISVTTKESASAMGISEYEAVTEKKLTHPFKMTPFRQLYKEFRVLERCTNMSKILKSRLRRLFLTSNLQRSVQIRIHDYILAMLHEALASDDIVEKHMELIRLQHSIPGISEFSEFLLLRDNCSPDIAEVLCFEPVCCFKKIQYKLEIIQEKFLTTEDVKLKCHWLNSLSKMLCYWILQRKKYLPCTGNCDESFDSDMSSDTSLHHITSVEINKLQSKIQFFCDTLIMEDSSPFVVNQILQHYQMVALARQLNEDFIACFPSPSVFQLSLFSLNYFTLDTLSELLLRISAIHDSKTHTMKNEEVILFQASCNDIRKVFITGHYSSENTYLAKTKAFKELNKTIPDFINSFILLNHPALLLITLEFDDRRDLKSIIVNPETKKKFLIHLAENGAKNFVRLITKIK